MCNSINGLYTAVKLQIIMLNQTTVIQTLAVFSTTLLIALFVLFELAPSTRKSALLSTLLPSFIMLGLIIIISAVLPK